MRHWLATQGRRCFRSVAAQPREQVVTHIAKNPAALVPAVRSTLGARPASDTLLFSISKDLPRNVLQQLAACLTEAPQHVGALTGSLDGVPGTPYSVSLASIPRSLATPFRSNIPGAPRIAVGRWPEQKEIWRTNPHKHTDHLESTGHWAPLWGRENVEHQVPAELEALPARDVRALFLFSDAYAQGLTEGLDFHFSQAHVLGSVAAFTPFVTGREHTLFFQTHTHARGIYEKGAVGLALHAPASLERTYSGLVPVGPRLAITSARGNIISSLNHHNAAQQMIWLLTNRKTAQGAPIQDPQHVRSMSSQVRKDDELFLGIFACQEDAMPLTMARIQSGHPMRGTISIDTDTQICPNMFAQLYRSGEHEQRKDPPIPALVRYTMASGAEMSSALKGMAPQQGTTNGVVSLPGIFFSASEMGWFGRHASQCAQAYTVPHASASLVWS